MTATPIALIAISTLCFPALGWAQDDRWIPEVLVNNTCIGDGRYGPREAAVASLGIHDRFRGNRIRPSCSRASGCFGPSHFTRPRTRARVRQ